MIISFSFSSDLFSHRLNTLSKSCYATRPRRQLKRSPILKCTQLLSCSRNELLEVRGRSSGVDDDFYHTTLLKAPKKYMGHRVLLAMTADPSTVWIQRVFYGLQNCGQNTLFSLIVRKNQRPDVTPIHVVIFSEPDLHHIQSRTLTP